MIRNSNFRKHFPQKCMSIIGMIHVRPLPGTPNCIKPFNIKNLIDHACHEASIYLKYGVHGICLENMFDRPYIYSRAGPEVVSTMTRVCSEVRHLVGPEFPLGIQVLAGLNHEALAVALASQMQFIRVEGFVFSHVADEGLMIEACAGPLLRYRRQIDAEHISILTDVKKKHASHAITNDLDVSDISKAAEFFLSDGIILTGKETGNAPNIEEINQVRKTLDNSKLPLLIGSGLTEQNLSQFIHSGIDGAIIGSNFKQNGQWYNEICELRVKNFMEKFNKLFSNE